MRKRIKARVKPAKRVERAYAEEVKRNGIVITRFIGKIPGGKPAKIQNIRYKGKVYFMVIICDWGSPDTYIAECKEL